MKPNLPRPCLAVAAFVLLSLSACSLTAQVPSPSSSESPGAGPGMSGDAGSTSATSARGSNAMGNGGSSGSGYMPAVSATSTTYRLQPYDVIDVEVYNEPDLHRPARLGSDGMAILPLIGKVHLAGLTVGEATDKIQKRYADGVVKDPSVLVTVLQYRHSTFSIMGQIGRQGTFEIPEGMHLSIVDAILMAGGFSRIADENSVRVKRMVGNKYVVLRVRAGDMARKADVVPFEVQAGDMIYVGESWL